MRRRLAIRVFTLALASFAALPATAHPRADTATPPVARATASQSGPAVASEGARAVASRGARAAASPRRARVAAPRGARAAASPRRARAAAPPRAGVVGHRPGAQTAVGPAVERPASATDRAGRLPGACAAAHARVSAETLRAARKATVCLINRERAAHGLPPLRLHPTLSRVAERHARDMVRHRYFAHVSRDGRSPFDRMLATRYVPRGARWMLGENIGWGTLTLGQPAALVRAWMRSAGHRRNILDRRFREVGVGIALGVPEPSFARQPGATYATNFGAVS